MINAIAFGSSVTLELRKLGIAPIAFYRWLDKNEEFRQRAEEAIALRNKLAVERIWGLALNETDTHARGRIAAAALIEKALAMQEGGMLTGYRGRRPRCR